MPSVLEARLHDASFDEQMGEIWLFGPSFAEKVAVFESDKWRAAVRWDRQ